MFTTDDDHPLTKPSWLCVPPRYDFIEIRDGNSDSADLVGRHCSNIAPPAIISSGSALHIKFVSDYAHQGAGFSLRYEIFKTGTTARLGVLVGCCGGMLSLKVGSLQY